MGLLCVILNAVGWSICSPIVLPCPSPRGCMRLLVSILSAVKAVMPRLEARAKTKATTEQMW